MIGLTPRQRALLDYLRARTEPWAASFEEMRDALGLKSLSGVQRLMGGLEERGYVRRLRNRARSVELLPPHVMIRGEPYRFIPKSKAQHVPPSLFNRGVGG